MMKKILMMPAIRIAVSMLALLMIFAYMSIISGQSAYAADEDAVELTKEQIENLDISAGEPGFDLQQMKPDTEEYGDIMKIPVEKKGEANNGKLQGAGYVDDGYEDDLDQFGAFDGTKTYPAFSSTGKEECSLDDSGLFVTYKFTPSESGKYQFYSTDNNEDTIGRIVVYDGETEKYRQLCHNDDNDGDDNFLITFSVSARKTYYLQAANYYMDMGAFTLHLVKVSDSSDSDPDPDKDPDKQGDGDGEYSASLDVKLNKSTGIATITGDVSGDTFEYLYIDDERCYDIDIYDTTHFSGEIDMRDYPVGMHTIYAVLQDHSSEADYVYYPYGVPTLIYSSQKPSIKLDYFYTSAKYFAYYYGGSSLDQDSSCGVYLDYKKKGGSWVTGYGPCSTNSSLRNVPSKKLKPKTDYVIRTYFGKKGTYNGESYFIKGKYSSSKTVKTASSKKLAIKKVKVSKVKVRYAGYWITTYNAWGQVMSRYPVYYTSFKLTVYLKKKPGTTGICIGNTFKKGNKKKYSQNFYASGTKKQYKGKKMNFEFCSYQNKTYKGYSPITKKTVKIK